jgi:hypothetical protein
MQDLEGSYHRPKLPDGVINKAASLETEGGGQSRRGRDIPGHMISGQPPPSIQKY